MILTATPRDCVRFGVVAGASPQLQDLYNWLEVDFHPLHLCNKVTNFHCTCNFHCN